MHELRSVAGDVYARVMQIELVCIVYEHMAGVCIPIKHSSIYGLVYMMKYGQRLLPHLFINVHRVSKIMKWDHESTNSLKLELKWASSHFNSCGQKYPNH